MTIQVNIGEAKTRLSELLQKLEDGEELIIARGNEPRYEVIIRDEDRSAAQAALARLKKLCGQNKSATRDEIKSWIEEGRA
jgi:antitoxin (DNA-binding transcriptional repressor) of toxin-antitoxin stability system